MHGYIDCHCHVSAGDFDKDIETVIERSKRAGLLALLAVAEYAGEFDKIIALSQRFQGFVFPCLGVHPVQEVSSEQPRSASLQDVDAALPIIDKYKEQLVALGEVGLDFTPRYVKSESDKASQRQVLIRQSHLAKELDLPLNVHSRSAGRPTIQLLKEQAETGQAVAAGEHVPGKRRTGSRTREAGEKRAAEHSDLRRVHQPHQRRVRGEGDGGDHTQRTPTLPQVEVGHGGMMTPRCLWQIQFPSPSSFPLPGT
ncbi:tatD DNase domain containing 3-like isoform X8 [Dunckerocampus dactyliophorus]|uniref:tatD DNase domain containing 3-like isoform X8 n=1 Tax=Dunckerocampus dactyliophorus TaxID=161453 RepID=UPI002405C626|nr:tatD DNase domain containing 3-like isoform X8 [Dunckerocampus dactyliophorus]